MIKLLYYRTYVSFQKEFDLPNIHLENKFQWKITRIYVAVREKKGVA